VYFPGFSWGEREASELLGINFKNKPDARRLMLDYSFEGHPLRKSFPCFGFEELSYNTRER
jgi:NADH:ubiquinone oxidoreductase subunit C